MKIEKNLTKKILFLTLVMFLFSNIAFAQSDRKNIFQRKPKTMSAPGAEAVTVSEPGADEGYIEPTALTGPEQVEIPQELGTVKEVYDASKFALSPGVTAPIIINIQDVHTNYEAQKKEAQIMEHLIKQHGIGVILTEGGISNRDFSYLRLLFPLSVRKEKAEKLLKEGHLRAPEYLDIATDFYLKFQGIEDAELYKQNLEIFLKVDKFREEAGAYIDLVKNIAENLKLHIYSPQQKKIDKAKTDYEEEKAKLSEYLLTLKEVSGENNFIWTGFSNLLSLSEIFGLETKIDFAKVSGETDTLLKQLTVTLSQVEQQRLVGKANSFKQGKITEAEFYQYLKTAAERQGVNFKDYQNLNLYVDYVSKYNKNLDPTVLFQELAKLEEKLMLSLCKTEQQKTLYQISRNLELLSNFLKIKLTPDDWRYYQENKSAFSDINAWLKFLSASTMQYKLEREVPSDASIITSNLATLEKFYTTAIARDRAFVKNTLAKLEQENETVAIMITGGFHTPHLTDLFREKGISYVVISPKITSKIDEEFYRDKLKNTYETFMWPNE